MKAPALLRGQAFLVRLARLADEAALWGEQQTVLGILKEAAPWNRGSPLLASAEVAVVAVEADLVRPDSAAGCLGKIPCWDCD